MVWLVGEGGREESKKKQKRAVGCKKKSKKEQKRAKNIQQPDFPCGPPP
jgi:hypothetical protein